MLECRVDQIRGKDVQSGITVRNRFNWTVKSVQTYSRHGYKNDSTITQVVFERDDEYPFKAELEPLEEVANGLKYPNAKPALRRLIAMLVLTAIFGILWFMYTPLLSLIRQFDSTFALPTFIPLVLLGITVIFGVLALIFLISSIVRSAINSKSMKKRKMILEATRRIQKGLQPMDFPFKKKKHKKSDEPVVPLRAPAPVVHVAPAPVHPAPVVHPVVQPTPQPVPHPVQPAPVVQPAPRPVQPAPQPVVQPAPRPVQSAPQPAVQPAPRPVQPAPQPAVQSAPRPVQPTLVQPAVTPVQPAPAQPVQPTLAKPIEPTVVKPVDPNAQ